MAKRIVLKKAVTRKPKKLYYIDAAGNVCESDMNRKGGKKGRKICAVKTKKAAAKKRKPATKKRAVKKVARKRAAPKKTARKKTTRRKTTTKRKK